MGGDVSQNAGPWGTWYTTNTAFGKPRVVGADKPNDFSLPTHICAWKILGECQFLSLLAIKLRDCALVMNSVENALSYYLRKMNECG